MVQPQVRQPRMGSPFESFGHSGPEVRQHSERGFQSLQGGRPAGASTGRAARWRGRNAPGGRLWWKKRPSGKSEMSSLDGNPYD